MPDAVKNYTSHQLTCNDRYSARYDSSETHGAFPESPEKARSDFGIGTVPRSNSRKRARCEIGAASRCFDGHDPPRSQRYEGLVSSALAGNEPFESLFRAAGPCLLVEAWRDAGAPRAFDGTALPGWSPNTGHLLATRSLSMKCVPVASEPSVPYCTS